MTQLAAMCNTWKVNWTFELPLGAAAWTHTTCVPVPLSSVCAILYGRCFANIEAHAIESAICLVLDVWFLSRSYESVAQLPIERFLTASSES